MNIHQIKPDEDSPANVVPRSPAGPENIHEQGLNLIVLNGTRHREFHITLTPRPSEVPAATVVRLAAALRRRQASIVRQEIFGAGLAEPETRRALGELLGPVCWPVLWVETAGTDGSPLAGIHTWAVVGTAVESIEVNGRIVGRAFVDDGARHVVLSDLRPREVQQPKPIQARQLFENLENGLKQSGMNCANLVRTWFFLDDILGWYGSFNKVRTEFYAHRRVRNDLLPASTGIGVGNSTGMALVAGAWAAQGLNDTFAVRQIPSPLQETPVGYGSSFARAVELVSGGLRRLLISGTASIAKDGRSAHPDDIHGQVELSMQVVRAILVSRGMDFADATRVTAYVKHPHYAPVFNNWVAEQRLDSWPMIIAPATVCRDELLFEIELDAISVDCCSGSGG